MADKQAEIFEKTEEQQQPLPPSESVQEEVEEVIKIKKVDGRRGKRKEPISEKQREQLLKNLAVGRAKGLATRRKKAELKRIEKEEKNNASDKLLLATLQKRELKTAGSDALLKKIADLESKLLQQQEAPPPAPKPVPTPKPAPVQHKNKDPSPARPPTPTPTPTPSAPPAAPPQRSKKELAKMMRGLR